MKKIYLLAIAVFALISVNRVSAQDSLQVLFDFENAALNNGVRNFYGSTLQDGYAWYAADSVQTVTPEAGGVTRVEDEDANRGWVAEFPDNNSHLCVVNDAEEPHLGWTGGVERTIALWVKTAKKTQTLVSMGDKGSGTKIVLVIDTGGELRFEVDAGYSRTSPVGIDDGEWHHVACVWNNTDNNTDGAINAKDVLMYFDGVLQPITAGTTREVSTVTSHVTGIGLDIQAPGTVPSRNFTGHMDDIYLLDGAKTLEEIIALAGEGLVTEEPEPEVFTQQEAYFSFDGADPYDGSYNENTWVADDTLSTDSYDESPVAVSFIDDAERGSKVANFTTMGGNLYIPGNKGWAGSAPRTICLWVKNPGWDNDRAGVTLVSMGSTASAKKYVFAIDPASHLRFEVAGGGLTTVDSLGFDDKWHHVACVWNNEDNTGDGNVNISDVLIYYDGSLVPVNTHAQIVNTDGTANYIGIGLDVRTETTMNYRNYVGLMDDVYILDGAKTQAEILELSGLATGVNKEIAEDVLVTANNKTITITNKGGKAHADIYSLTGVLVKSVDVAGSATVTMAQSGLYIVAVRQNGAVNTQKVLLTE